MKHLNEEQFILYYYREPGGVQDVEGHLAVCEECRKSFEKFRTLLDGISAPPVPERDEQYGAEVWQRVRKHLPERRGWDWAALFQPRRLIALGTVAALIVVAFLAGRFWPRPGVPSSQPISRQARERVLLVAVGDQLDRSQMLLVELLNAPKDGKVDISDEQRRAEDLVSANRLYRQTAARTGDATVDLLLDDLERTLLEIAHSPSTLTSAEFDRFRRRIEARGILFKVRIVGAQVREREKEMNQSSGKRST